VSLLFAGARLRVPGIALLHQGSEASLGFESFH